MSSSKDKEDNTPTPPTTIGGLQDHAHQAELDVRMERNRLEAQRRRNNSQLEAANNLQALALQQQEEIRKLREHARYNQLRGTTLLSKMSPSNDTINLKKHSSSIHVSTFNPPRDNDSSTINITPDSDSSFANGGGSIVPTTLDSDAIKPKAALLLPVLGTQPDAPLQVSVAGPCPPSPEVIDMTNESSPANPEEVIDITNDSSHEASPKKRHKGTTVEVKVIVKMQPGCAHPSVKTVHSTVESTDSDHDSEN